MVELQLDVHTSKKKINRITRETNTGEVKGDIFIKLRTATVITVTAIKQTLHE